MLQKLILIDCDGVVLAWEEAFGKFVVSKGLEYNPDRSKYYMSERIGCDIKIARALVNEFNSSDLICKLPSLYDSVSGMKKLSDAGFRFIAISSFSNDPVQIESRHTNLVNLFGDVFDKVHGLQSGSKKTSILESWKDSGLFWIEDYLPNALDGNTLGLNTILIDEPHNQFQTDQPTYPNRFYRASTGEHGVWEKIANRILNHYSE